MPGNFAFLRGKFPELADDGEKAEKYLYYDNEVCMFFISRIFDNVVKILCSINGVKNNGDNMAGSLSELFKNKAITACTNVGQRVCCSLRKKQQWTYRAVLRHVQQEIARHRNT